MSHSSEIVIDQAHRGYTVTTDQEGYRSVNPLYMAYEPGPDGHFAGALSLLVSHSLTEPDRLSLPLSGHHGYGYKSIAAFVKAATAINAGVC